MNPSLLISNAKAIRSLLLALFALCCTSVAAWGTPYIFNVTESAAPGDLFYVQGDNFSTNPQVWFHRVLTTDTTLTPDVQITPLVSSTNQAITAQLPKNAPIGLYAIWVKDSGGNLSAPVFINRARAMSFEYPAVSPGYTFRIFGRNLFMAGATPKVTFTNGSNTYNATVVTGYANDGYVLQVTAPSTLPTSGTYTVNVSNGYGHNSLNVDTTASEETILSRTGGADPFGLGVPWAPDFVNIAADVINIATTNNPHTSQPYGYGLTTGATGSNWVNAIQQALYDAGNPTYHPNGATVSLPIATLVVDFSSENLQFYGPAGTLINQNAPNSTAHYELNLPSHVVLKGAGIGSTIIQDNSPAYSGYSYFITIANASPNNGSLSGVQGFTCVQNMTISNSSHPPDIRNCAINSSEIFFDHISIAFQHAFFSDNKACICGDFEAQTGSNNTNVLTQNCTLSGMTFGNANAYAPHWSYGSNYIYRNNNISAWFRRLELIYMSSVLVENNHFTRDANFPPANYGGSPTQGGIEFTEKDNKILNNIFDTVNVTSTTPLPYENDQETFNSQGQPSQGYDLGTITADSSTTLTDSGKNWPANFLVGQTVTIETEPAGGVGRGETATIIANTANTLTLSPAWTTVPSVADTYQIAGALNFYDYGTVAGSTSTTVTCTSGNPAGTYFPTGYGGLAGQVLAIVNGPGTGQWRYIASNTSNTITVTQPWTENPTTASTYSVTGATSDHVLLKGNTLTGDLPRGFALYCGSHDSAVVNNLFENTGETIYLRSDQRTLSGTAWSGRMNLTWNDVVTDNMALDTDGSFATTISAELYQTAGHPLAGTIVLDPEFRRNVIVSDFANKKDGAIGLYEGYSNSDLDSNPSFTETHIPGLLATIFDDNLNVNTNSSNTNYPTYLNTDTYLTSFLNQLNMGYFTLTPQQYSDATLPGAGHASVDTTWTVDPTFFSANFKGSGTSTGGTSDMIDTGGTGLLQAGAGDTMVVASASPFIPGVSGDYLESSMTPTGGAAHFQITPTFGRTSWGRIFDYRTGQWLVNGGFDFFWRPVTAPAIGNAMRPIDISNNDSAHGLRFTFHNYTSNSIQMEVITASGGGGIATVATYSPGFTAGTIYHIGVTFVTNPTTGVTTAKIFAVAGTGAINTTVGTNLISTSTFTLNPSIVTDDSGWLSGAAWTFGDSYGNGTNKTNDYDGFHLYSQDPGNFPALGD
ncbi:MAG: hypothetical protein WCD79_12435 [Chthoniobacteraceae bacterium]